MQLARHSQPTGIPRPHPWLFMGVQACRLPALKRLKRSKRLKPLQGHINGFLWASSAGKSYPKARSIAFSGRSSVPLARHSQPTGIPRPHPWLFMGVQACRLPALKRLKRSKRLKPLQGHINGFLWASSAGKSYPKARSIAFSGRSSVPFARHSQPTGSPRPHQWLLVRQAFAANGQPKATSMASYGLPAQAKATPRPDPLLFLGGPACRWPGIRSQQASQGHIHGFLWASKLAVCQPLNA